MRIKSFFKNISIFIRSCIFSVFMMLLTFFYSFICVLSYPCPLSFRYKVVTLWTRTIIWLLKIICRIDYRVEGRENIPHRNGVVLSKHQSAWETLFLPTLFYEAAIIVKRELLWVPFFGWGLAALSPIAINRKDKSSSLEQILQQGARYLRHGRWILIFPEGTRIAPGATSKYRLGGAKLAATTGYPVVPVAHNAGLFWPRRGFLKKPGTIRVVIGPVIEGKDHTAEEIMSRAKQWIEETVAKICRVD